MRSRFALVIALVLISCAAPTHFGARTTKSYTIGEVEVVPLGAPMIVREDVVFAENGGVITGGDSFREELIYSGRYGDAIKIHYREFRQDFARPSFFQELQYDLSQSDVVVFRSYRIEIHDAGNESISFTVLSDR